MSNAVAEDLLQRQRDELHILHQIAGICIDAEDEDTLFARCTTLLGEALYTDNFGFILLDAKHQFLKLHPSYHDQPDVIQPATIPLSPGICGKVVRTGHTIRLGEVNGNNDYLPVDPHTRSELCVPLKLGEQIIGVLNAESRHPEAFSENDERLLFTVASQLTVAISNLRLLQSEARRRKEAETLQRATATLTSSLNLGEVLDAILVSVAQVLPYDTASIFLAEGGNLRVVAARGFPEGTQIVGKEYLAHDVFYQAVRKSHRPLYVGDTQAEEQFHFWGPTPYIRAWMCIPLLSEGQVFGCLTLDSRTPYLYTESHAELAQAFAYPAAIALQNARLFDETRRQNRELLALYDTALTLGTVLNRDELLMRIGEQVYLLMAPDSMGVILYEEAAQMLELVLVIEEGERMAEAKGMRVPLSEAGLSGWLIQNGKSMLFDDLLTETPPVTPKHIYQPARAWLGVPIFVRGKLCGLITVQSFHPAAFDEQHVRFMEAVAAQVAIALENARLYEELEQSYLQTVFALARAMDARDAYTSDHSQRLSVWAEAIAQEMGCPPEQIRAIHWAALLHDIGKIGVPDEILRKPGPLTELEWTIMKKHPEDGAEIVAPVKRLAEVAPIIRAHQEKYDGSGYPHGLKGDQIPLG
ncbi:MAG TPA: GAF domain-containing protein, partial [Anaerolineales bacterium]|nr:GAF domain-containing protein [Anaerolineales bacterium]